MKQDSLIETLQQLGFTQYEAQCYLGLLRQHPLNGSQLSTACGVPRSMVYQTLNRLEEKAAVVRLSGEAGEPQQYEPVAPRLVIAQLSAQFQATCEQVEQELNALTAMPPAEVVCNIIGTNDILKRAALLVRQAQRRIALMGAAPELTALTPDLQAAVARGVSARVVSIGAAPDVTGQVVTFFGENVSAPTRFLMIIADTAHALIATFPPDAQATAVLTDNPILARLLSAFLNTEYYLVRQSNRNPALVSEMLAQVLEPEDRARYARILHFLDQQAKGREIEEGRR
ncbi:MAG TPA: helix-turn-helix domain-containing protein [Ktedonosporobacter sp.]|nr:helix-turn-helix domain-containing protein [Ktedonosporobacter sp.]